MTHHWCVHSAKMAGKNNSKSKKNMNAQYQREAESHSPQLQPFPGRAWSLFCILIFLPLRSKWGFIQQLRCLSINQISLTNLLPCQFSEVLIENCTAHFPSSRNNQIDAASNQSKQVHKMLVSLSLRTFMWRWSGKWFQIVYNIFIRVRQCFATF